jgi:hypothetical protein
VDDIGYAWKAMLSERVTTLDLRRMNQVGKALNIATGCGH